MSPREKNDDEEEEDDDDVSCTVVLPPLPPLPPFLLCIFFSVFPPLGGASTVAPPAPQPINEENSALGGILSTRSWDSIDDSKGNPRDGGGCDDGCDGICACDSDDDIIPAIEYSCTAAKVVGVNSSFRNNEAFPKDGENNPLPVHSNVKQALSDEELM